MVTQLFDEKLKPSGLLTTQFTVLAVIAYIGSAPINDLAKELVMDRTTLTRNLKPLERQELISIQPGDDQRVRVVSLTSKGQTALQQAIPLWQDAQAFVVQKLGQTQWEILLLGLLDVVSSLIDPV